MDHPYESSDEGAIRQLYPAGVEEIALLATHTMVYDEFYIDDIEPLPLSRIPRSVK
jgi:hypothetical protein